MHLWRLTFEPLIDVTHMYYYVMVVVFANTLGADPIQHTATRSADQTVELFHLLVWQINNDGVVSTRQHRTTTPSSTKSGPLGSVSFSIPKETQTHLISSVCCLLDNRIPRQQQFHSDKSSSSDAICSNFISHHFFFFLLFRSAEVKMSYAVVTNTEESRRGPRIHRQ